jgi:cell division protein ZapA
MPEIAITVNGRSYRVNCGPGEEARLQSLAQGLDQRVERLVRSAGQAGEAQLLLAAGLLLADELDETRTELAQLRAAPVPRPAAPPPVDDGAERRAAAAIEMLAQRIEAIAEQLERA